VDCGFLAVFRRFLTRYGGAPAGLHGQRPARRRPVKHGKNRKKRGAGAAAGGFGAVASGARPVDLPASGAANFPEKLTGGQRPARRGTF